MTDDSDAAIEHEDLIDVMVEVQKRLIRDGYDVQPLQPPSRRTAWANVFNVLVALLMVLVLGSVAISLLAYTHSTKVYDPLSFPRLTQINLPPGPDNRPIVTLGQDIPVTFTKCSADALTANRTSSFVPISPNSSAVPNVAGATTFVKGCQTLHAMVVQPQAFIDRNKKLFAEGYTHVTWVIRGVYTPQTNRNSTSRTLSTEQFDVLNPVARGRH